MWQNWRPTDEVLFQTLEKFETAPSLGASCEVNLFVPWLNAHPVFQGWSLALLWMLVNVHLPVYCWSASSFMSLRPAESSILGALVAASTVRMSKQRM